MNMHKMMTAAILATGLVTLAPATLAGSKLLTPAEDAAAPKEAVTIMIKRSDVSGYPWVKEVVQADKLEERMAELLRDPNVLHVEVDRRVSTPDPVIEVSPRRVGPSAQSSDTDPLYNDTQYRFQEHFTPGLQYNSQFEPAHRRLSFDRTIRVGVADSSFRNSVDVEYGEGVTTVEPRQNDFIIGEGGLCTNDNGDDFHGNDVSHLIGATTNNALGMAGASPNVEIIGANVYPCNSRTTSAFALMEGVRWLAGGDVDGLAPIAEPVDIINISSGGFGECSVFEQDVIDFAVSQGIVVVVAAGNESDNSALYSPNNCQGVISVAATDSLGRRTTFTNQGDNVDISAQGQRVLTISPEGNNRTIAGTSFSAPIVAGAVAMLKSERPFLTPQEIDVIIAQSGKPINSGFQGGMGAGILDAMLMLDAAGVPREVFTLEFALDGERARFVEALTHPAVDTYLTNRGSAPACDLVAVDTRTMTEADPDAPLQVFSVPAGNPLDPIAADKNQLAFSDAEQVLLDVNTFVDGFDYGVSKCDLVNGADCNQVDTIRGLDVASLQAPAACLAAL